MEESILQKAVINKIRSEVFNLGLDGRPIKNVGNLLQMLNGASELLSEGLYERTDHFLFELIQNAEDNAYGSEVRPKLKFHLLDYDPTNTAGSAGSLLILNNEVGFNEQNVKAISSFNQSTKKNLKESGFIGEKGIGFKSVFLVSDSPHIYSNGYQFKFLRKDPITTIGYVVPHWLDAVPDIVSTEKEYNTAILLPVNGEDYKFIKGTLEEFKPEVLLFLRKLLSIEIRTTDFKGDVESSIVGASIGLTINRNSQVEVKNYWLHSAVIKVPEDINEDKRKGVKESKISIAFPLNGVTGEERLFAYLPTEAKPGFPFFINADFLLPSSRESIFKNRSWNDWILQHIPQVVADGIKSMASQSQLLENIYQFIPLPKNVRGDQRFIAICDGVRDILKQSKIVWTEENELQFPSHCYNPSIRQRGLLTGKKASLLRDNYLVHSEISRYSEQLRYIGVRTISKDLFLEILGESDWVMDHSTEWFVDLFEYLCDMPEKKRDIQSLKLVPTNSGRLVAPKEGFYPITKKDISSFNIVPAIYRNKIPIATMELLDKIYKSESVEKILGMLNLKNFGSLEFVKEVLMPEVMSQIETISPEDFRSVVSYLFESDLNFNSDSVIEIIQDFPVLLSNGKIINPPTGWMNNLVTPKTFDLKKGWQLVFDREETKHLSILDDHYSHLDRLKFEEYSNMLGITDCPPPPIITVFQYTRIDGLSSDYQEYIKNAFLNNRLIESKRLEKSVETFVPPDSLNRCEIIDEGTHEALVRWIDHGLSDHGSFLIKARGIYQNRGKREHRLDSALYSALLSKPWIKTTKGFYKPGEVFEKNKTTHSIFGDQLPYLLDPLAEDVVKLLGIKQDVSVESLISLLIELRNKDILEDGLLVRIYEYLFRYGSEYEDVFRENNIIFIPDREGIKWLKSSEVIWNDESSIFGQVFGWLSGNYPDTLKDFFVTKLKVKTSVDESSYADAWLNLQNANNDVQHIESVLNLLLPRMASAFSKADQTWKKHFVENAKIWTQSNCWVSPESVIVPDDSKLRALFDKRLQFPWRPDDLSHVRLNVLYKAFALEKLSEITTFTVNKSVPDRPRRTKKYLTDHTLRLLCYAVHNYDQDGNNDFERHFDSGLLGNIFSTEEVDIDTIDLTVTVRGHSAEIKGRAAFFDRSAGKLYINRNSDDQDILDDIAQDISRLFWPRGFKDNQDTIRKFLSVSTEERFRKLRDNLGWHLSHQYLKVVSELLGGITKGKQTPNIMSEVKEDQDDHDIAANTPPSSREVDGSQTNSLQEVVIEEGFKRTETQPTSDKLKHGDANFNKEVVCELPGKDYSSKEELGTLSTGDKSNEFVPAVDRQIQSSGYSGNNLPLYRQNTDLSRRNVAKGRVSRSSGIAKSINQARRSSLKSYVVPEVPAERSEDSEDVNNRLRQELGELGETEVLNDLQSKGYAVKRMPANNKGYDIEAINPDTGEVLYIEVKGESFNWTNSEKGVGITREQFRFGQEKRESFYLAVVENLRDSPRRIYYIQDPVGAITEYRFDGGWEGLAAPLGGNRSSLSSFSPHSRLMELTNSEQCKQIILYCHEHGFPLPEVGLELEDNAGQVIDGELELAWEEELFGVVVDESELGAMNKLDLDWLLLDCGKFDAVVSKLNQLFGGETHSELEP